MTHAVDNSSRGSYAPASQAALGTFDAPRTARRITTEKLQKMRDHQTRQQRPWSVAVRTVNEFWSLVRDWLTRPLSSKKVYQCDANGHALTRVGTYDFLPVCRFCGRHADSLEEFRPIL